MPSRPKWIS